MLPNKLMCSHKYYDSDRKHPSTQICVFSNTPYLLEIIWYSLFSTNDPNQMLDEWIANGIQNTYNVK